MAISHCQKAGSSITCFFSDQNGLKKPIVGGLNLSDQKGESQYLLLNITPVMGAIPGVGPDGNTPAVYDLVKKKYALLVEGMDFKWLDPTETITNQLDVTDLRLLSQFSALAVDVQGSHLVGLWGQGPTKVGTFDKLGAFILDIPHLTVGSKISYTTLPVAPIPNDSCLSQNYIFALRTNGKITFGSEDWFPKEGLVADVKPVKRPSSTRLQESRSKDHQWMINHYSQSRYLDSRYVAGGSAGSYVGSIARTYSAKKYHLWLKSGNGTYEDVGVDFSTDTTTDDRLYTGSGSLFIAASSQDMTRIGVNLVILENPGTVSIVAGMIILDPETKTTTWSRMPMTSDSQILTMSADGQNCVMQHRGLLYSLPVSEINKNFSDSTAQKYQLPGQAQDYFVNGEGSYKDFIHYYATDDAFSGMLVSESGSYRAFPSGEGQSKFYDVNSLFSIEQNRKPVK